MKEILFRAKQKDNGGCVEGFYVCHVKRTPYPIGDKLKPEDVQHLICRDAFSDWGISRGINCYEIDRDTLCQCSGVDEKGEKIWEKV